MKRKETIMRFSSAFGIVETISATQNTDFYSALEFLHNNLNKANKYQKMAYSTLIQLTSHDLQYLTGKTVPININFLKKG